MDPACALTPLKVNLSQGKVGLFLLLPCACGSFAFILCSISQVRNLEK